MANNMNMMWEKIPPANGNETKYKNPSYHKKKKKGDEKDGTSC